ncbi:MAG: hypothetical protein IJH07_01505 [Ruminococcus sp.]|nr:hypothetical protein [Ruminococcus sp.]
MQKDRQVGWTAVFIILLLVAGACNLLTRTGSGFFNSLMFSLNFVIYAGLLLLWSHSVRVRLLPTRARRYLVSAAALMLAYLMLRVTKYRIVINSVFLSRYLVYAYFVPMVMIPTLFLMTSICIRRGEDKTDGIDERLLLIPAFILSLFALSNDWHRLIYCPEISLSDFFVESGTYTYGFGLYVLYGWIGLTLAVGFFLLLRESGSRSKKGTVLLIGDVLLWLGLVLLCILVFYRYDLPRMFGIPEIHIFGMLGILEICIQCRLIPHNEDYRAFFPEMDLPLMLTDRQLAPVYQTRVKVSAQPEQLSEALRAPLYTDEDTKLSGMKLSAGYAFWTEDERELNRERSRLDEANELLSEENDLIKAEHTLKEKMAHIEAQNQVYDRIAIALYPKQQEIAALLENVRPEKENFRAVLARCCVLNAYSKRKSNLLLLSEETLPERNRELFLAMQESARYLKYCGIEAAATGEEFSTLPLSAIHVLYDTFELIVEAYLDHMKKMTASLMEDGIRLAVETAFDPPLSGTPLPVSRQNADGYTFLTVRAKKGGDVRD